MHKYGLFPLASSVCDQIGVVHVLSSTVQIWYPGVQSPCNPVFLTHNPHNPIDHSSQRGTSFLECVGGTPHSPETRTATSRGGDPRQVVARMDRQKPAGTSRTGYTQYTVRSLPAHPCDVILGGGGGLGARVLPKPQRARHPRWGRPRAVTRPARHPLSMPGVLPEGGAFLPFHRRGRPQGAALREPAPPPRSLGPPPPFISGGG